MTNDSDGTIDLREHSTKDEDVEFCIEPIEEEVDGAELKRATSGLNDKVKIKFDKFVNLVAAHAYEDIFDKYSEEDVIVSTDLLADLANSHEEKSDKKVPLVFIVGIVLGVAVAWILLRT